MSEGANVLAMDFKSVYAGMREAEGRHFNRGEFFARVQNPDFTRSVLMEEGGSDVLKWLSHPRRDARKADANLLDKCIFFEGQRYYLIGCTARQNGIGIEGD